MTSGTRGKHPDSRFAVLGKPGVGKSALVVRFLTKRFIWEYDSSQERTYRHQTVIDEEQVLLEILDTAGPAKDDSIHREGLIRWADGFIVVYAVNDRDSFDEVKDIKQYLDQVKRTNVHCVLVGNKTDLLHERKVTASEGRQLAIDLSCAFFETSASDCICEISEAFQDLHRDIKRRKQMEGKPRRRSSAQQVRQAFSKMFKIQGPT